MNFGRTLACLVSAVVSLSACVRGENAATADSASVVQGGDSVIDPAPGIPTSTEWVITARGLGPLRAGMTVAEARAASGGSLEAGGDTTSSCSYALLQGNAPGVRLMIERGVVTRVDVDSGNVATSGGARVGDSEERIKSLYPGVVVSPHKYTDGRYLTVSPAASEDSAYRIVFETNGRVVTRYRAGRRPSVEYVEGCS